MTRQYGDFFLNKRREQMEYKDDSIPVMMSTTGKTRRVLWNNKQKQTKKF